ncbi:MAG: carboxylating nicotinate-nucleotide diphosphorylase [Leptolyngbyaceae cyanobacterium bins.349]|nr:carboxylating nicotinate-nucleotide diphosphorylase [Leptolyngbyaceae cyanobacterium bins.349]
MKHSIAALPSALILEPLLRSWLLEDIGRGDMTTDGLIGFGNSCDRRYRADWIVKEAGVIAGLLVAANVFKLLDPQVCVTPKVDEGEWCEPGTLILQIQGAPGALLTGERTALNLAMRLSGIATAVRSYVDLIKDLPAQLVDTRKTTPGLRILEKYAVRVGGATNHRLGLDDGVMLKDNHIAAAGGISEAIARVRRHSPYPLSIEVETEDLAMVQEAIQQGADIIMLDNMPLTMMHEAVQMIRQANNRIKIEASGNITLTTIRAVAETGVDYISTSAPVTRSTWLDLSMRLVKD